MTTAPTESGLPPGERVEIIKSSVRCFVYSLVGLVPFVGLPFSLAAIRESRKVQEAAGAAWNPAGRYLRIAGRLAPLGFVTSAGCLVVVCLLIAAAGSGALGGSGGG